MKNPYQTGYAMGFNYPEASHKAKIERLYKEYDPGQWEAFKRGLQAGREESPNY